MLARQLPEFADIKPTALADPTSTPKLARLSLLQTRSTLGTAPAKPDAGRDADAAVSPETSTADTPSSPPAQTASNDAFALLEEVKRFIPLLMKENDELRASLDAHNRKAQADVRLLQDQANEWQSVADELTAEVTSLGATVLDLRGRLERAESAAAGEREVATKASQQAAEAECLSKLFEDTVISSFGIGTMFQNARARISGK